MPLTYKEHLVACLAEEAGEIGQMANKALRFYNFEKDEVIVGNDRTDGKTGTALELLMEEINDFIGVLELLHDAHVLPLIDIQKINAKKEKVKKYWQMVAEKSLSHDSICDTAADALRELHPDIEL